MNLGVGGEKKLHNMTDISCFFFLVYSAPVERFTCGVCVWCSICAAEINAPFYEFSCVMVKRNVSELLQQNSGTAYCIFLFCTEIYCCYYLET